MYIQIPFLDYAVLDTSHADSVTSGPTTEELEDLAIELEDRSRNILVCFGIPGANFRVRVEQIEKHETLTDTWWLRGVLDSGDEMEVYILWSPKRSYTSYLVTLVDTIDTYGWR